MLPKLFQSPGLVWNIAHRGASANFPENTMAAFRAAVSQQADMIELDVQRTADGVPVVFHDGKLHHHSNGRGAVSDYTLKELQKLDAGAWFSEDFAGEPIPTLEEVLDFTDGTIALNIEIKTKAVNDEIKNGIERQCLEMVEQYGMREHVLFSSFDGRAVRHLKTLDNYLPVALLYSRKWAWGRQPVELVRHYKADAFNCSYRQLSQRWTRLLKSHDIPIFIYNVDDPGRLKKLIQNGVKGIFVNQPGELLKILAEIDMEVSSQS